VRVLLPLSLLFVAWAFAEEAKPSKAGDLRGTIEITRVLTKKRVAVESYQNRGAALENLAQKPGDFSEMDVVVVYWDQAGAVTSKPAAEGVELRQKNRRFSESLLVVEAGATVSFPNHDPIFHNVFSLSKARSFDLGYYPQGQTRKVTFAKPGLVDVFCHLHPNMSASILVVPNRVYARPDREGNFLLEGLPTGEHEIVAWHRAAGFFRKKVTVPGMTPHFILPVRE
jgi:plastocyanin